MPGRHDSYLSFLGCFCDFETLHPHPCRCSPDVNKHYSTSRVLRSPSQLLGISLYHSPFCWGPPASHVLCQGLTDLSPSPSLCGPDLVLRKTLLPSLPWWTLGVQVVPRQQPPFTLKSEHLACYPLTSHVYQRESDSCPPYLLNREKHQALQRSHYSRFPQA